MRTVTVWFQNRRQLAKKTDENANALRETVSVHSALDEYRRPLSAVDQPHENIVSQTPANSRRTHGPKQAISTLQAAARKQVQSVPSYGYAVSSPSPSATPLLIRIGDPDDELRARRDSGGKRTLEWACSRSEKRARLYRVNRHDEDDRGNTTEEESEASQSMEAAGTLTNLKRQPLEEVSIPAEYTSRYAPDVLLGASLLLTFKYSAN